MDDFDASLEAVLDAIRAHAAAVRENGDVASAVRRFHEANNVYADLLYDLGREEPWHAVADAVAYRDLLARRARKEPPEAVAQPREIDRIRFVDGEWAERPEPVDGDLIAVRARADFVLLDRDALLAAATASRRVAEGDPEAWECQSVGEAIQQYLSEAGVIMEVLHVPGLYPRDALLVGYRASAPLVREEDLGPAEGDTVVFVRSEEAP